MCRPVVIGNIAWMEEAVRLVGARSTVKAVEAAAEAVGNFGTVEVLDLGNLDAAGVSPGVLSALAGKAAVEWALEAGNLAIAGVAGAIATAPFNKEAASLAGYKEVGHMELYQRLCGARDVATMLMSGTLRVVHLTTHRSLRYACDAVTHQNVYRKLDMTHRAFKKWGFKQPRIGVAALNPHASDGGLFGDEEEKQIGPAVEEAKSRGWWVEGPIPCDVVFHQAIQGRFDVVLAMYHDQGHIPVKVHGFEQSVSLNLGLPFIRTSVDHGTAFDIAGKGVANHQGMLEAIRVAASLARYGHLPL
jgi:4-hydroxythreonine-4-phosphate dehydrogenase